MGEALSLYEEGELWRDITARHALPILLWCARNGKKITYGELAEEIQHRGGEPPKVRMTLYGMPAGKIGDLMESLSREWHEVIPPVNAILVNKGTGLPGDGADEYLRHYLWSSMRRRLTDNRRSELAGKVIQNVFSYGGWQKVGAYFGFRRLDPVRALVDANDPAIPLPPMSAVWGTGGESEQHRRLREWVAEHPAHFVDFGAFPRGQMEVPLYSGDKVDVLFANAETTLAVEVKAANAPESEMWRGVFQCIKYRAVLRATGLVREDDQDTQVLLAVERQPSADIIRAAERLEVPLLVIDRGARK